MIDHLIRFVQMHGQLDLLCGWIFSAIVAGMPEPGPQDGRYYCWAYKTLHIITANKDMRASFPRKETS